ncbi:hypothetical protein ACIPQJ_04290 [Streptomyces sp. NPDC090082]|uniref:hypothetical protein n=1 Tax=unclassified Streptomyces TaxID=2593676 RepID=UPI0037F7C7E0
MPNSVMPEFSAPSAELAESERRVIFERLVSTVGKSPEVTRAPAGTTGAVRPELYVRGAESTEVRAARAIPPCRTAR